MKASSLSELKHELKSRTPEELALIILRLSKFKKENKELLSFLLFEADNVTQFIHEAKEEMDLHFSQLNTNTVFFAKKTLRKVLRNITKYAKISGSKEVEIELLLHFLRQFIQSGLPIHLTPILVNMQSRIEKKLETLILSLHEDLQYDYQKEKEDLYTLQEKKHLQVVKIRKR